MIITWHGHYTVKIATPKTTLVLDPHSKTKDYPAFRGKADIVALSHPQSEDMSYLDGIQNEPLLINTPGEFAISELTLTATGWHGQDGTERSLQRWTIEGITIIHLGALDRLPSDQELQQLEQTDVDILLLPIGNKHTLPLKDALSLLTVIEPKVVMPINYKSVKEFAEQLGISGRKKQPKLTIAANKLPAEGMETVIVSA